MQIALHSGAKVADESRMVKAFHRPDAGKEEQLPSDLRSPAVLQTTVRYLLDHIASPALSLAEHHKFVWDRTRCIRNDFTIQASSRLEDIKIAIQCYEEIARFHILSLHQMPKIGRHDYDAQQELEQLSATLLTLFEYYDDNRDTYEAPCEAEFRVYKLLIDIRSRTNDTLERVQTWPIRIRDSARVQTAIQLCQASGNVSTRTASMLSPYARSVQVEAAQYSKFWSIMDSPKVDYLMACAASVSFNEIRARTLETMAKVYRSGPTSRLQDFSLGEMTYLLGLDSNSQTRTLFRKSGLSISKHENGVSYLDLDELSGPFPKSSVASVEQIFSRSVVELKREDRVFSAVYKGLDIGHCRANGLIDESEGEAEFEPNAEDVDSEDEREDSLFVDGQEEDNEMDEEPSDATTIAANPFASTFPTNHGLKSGSSSFPKASPFFSSGGFGQPSALQAPTQTSSKPVGIFAASTPAQSKVSTNPFQQSTTSSTTITNTSTGSTLFGRPTSLGSKTIEPTKPSTTSSTEVDSTAISKVNAASTVTPKPSIEASPAGPFSWKPPATSHLNPFAQFPSQTTFTSSDVSDQTSKQPAADSSISGSGNLAPTKKPLFPFASPSPAMNKIENATVAAATATSQPPVSASLFEPKRLESAPISFPGSAAGSTFPTPPLLNQTHPVHMEAQTQLTTTRTSLSAEPSTNKTTLQTPSNASTSFMKQPDRSQPVAPSGSISNSAGLKLPSPGPISRDTSSLIPTPPVVTREQKKAVLETIAKDLFLGEYGILEQFIEANLGQIYDKAQRKVTKERRKARLAEIKQSLISSKFFILWKLRVNERLQRKKAVRRRERMRQSRYEDPAITSVENDVERLGHKQQIGLAADGQLKYLTRGFQETFDKSVSRQDRSLLRERSASEVHDIGYKAETSQNKSLATVSKRQPQSGKHYRHSHSQSVDGSSRASAMRPSSSSMPPPYQPSRSSLLAKHNSSIPMPFVGSGFLQDAASRREAINLARRAGPMTTTESDYFRLKARNIDPNTGVIPSTRKRKRGYEDVGRDRSLSKSRRLSASTMSSIALSSSPLQLSAKTKSSETELPSLNGQSQAVSPKFTDEEEALFAAARKLRETLAEDTEWMRTMREEYEKEEANLKAETPAQRRLREFKMTPSKTSIRLRQTYANGLLPPDFFEKQSVGKDMLNNTATTAKGLTLDSPTPKMGLAALSKDRHKRHHDTSSTTALMSRGASADEAIEL